MYEVEVKVEAAHGPVRERLADLGAEPLGAVHQRDTYYDHPSRSFAESDEAFRLRRETALEGHGAPHADGTVGGGGSATNETARGEDGATTARLTYKGPLVDGVSKTREEVETDVDDPEAADSILRAVGFEPAAEVDKERERFAVDGYVVALDSVRDLGEYVEVEAHADGEEAGDEDAIDANAGGANGVAAVRDGAFDLCRRLDLDPDESIRSSYLALLLETAG